MKNFENQQASSLALSQIFPQIQNLHRHYFDGCFELSLSQILADCDSRCESTAKQTQNAESALDSANSQNLIKNQVKIPI